MSVIQVHREPSHEHQDIETLSSALPQQLSQSGNTGASGRSDGSDTSSLASLFEHHYEDIAPPQQPSRNSSLGVSEGTGDSETDSLASLFEDRHEDIPAHLSQILEDPSALPVSVPGTHRRYSQQALKPDRIPFIFLVPTASGHGFTYQRIHDFPRAFQADFREEFKQQYLTPGHKDRKPLYEVCVRRENRQAMAASGICIHMKIYSRRISDYDFEGSMGNKNRACDCCTRLSRFCARILKVERAYQLVLYPVREGLRKNLKEEDMEFWRKWKEYAGAGRYTAGDKAR
jgi:hypothetical protein